MARPRKKGTLIVGIVLGVVVLGAAAWFVKGKLAVGNTTAGAADSSATTADNGDKDGKGKKGEKKKKDERVPVEVALAGVREISSYYATTATLEAQKKVDVLAKVAGDVVELVAEEGDRVKSGQLLARMDDREAKIALEESRITRDQKKRELDRLRGMRDQNLISDKEWSDAEHEFQLADNKYESAKLQMSYTQIRAPFAGVVTERVIDAGQNVTVGTKLFALADTDPLELTMYIPEKELRSLAAGQLVRIQPDVNPDMEFDGHIVRIAPEVDEKTGTVRVTAETDGGGIPGSFVRVRIVTDTRPSTLTVPRRGVISDAGERFVFIAEADTVRRVDVTVGYEDAEFTEVTSGLTEGDSVVTAGVGGLREGSKIRVLGKDNDAVAESAEN